jgi:glycerol-3-phosphate dehydrogenase (NAD(P)+)
MTSVRLWVHDAALAARMSASRENETYLPGFLLPANVEVTSSLGESLVNADAVVLAVPSHVARGVLTEMPLAPGTPIVSATKGIEQGTLSRMSEVIEQAAGARPIAVLSGPSFAREVAAGKPTALVAASLDAELAKLVQSSFSSGMLRIYTSADPVGVELGGAVKNVIAIGAGVCHGLGLGHNALAALVTRGLVEMSRLTLAMGGQAATLSGLAGLGDLILTCTGDLSRNRQTGIDLAHGRKLEEIVAATRMVAEGIRTTSSVVALGRRFSIELPISREMDAVIHSGSSPAEAIRRLMDRTLREE